MRADSWLNDLVEDINQRVVMTRGTLTSTMGRTDHPIGMFLRALTQDGVRALPRFPADAVPLLVSADHLTGGDHATIGTAFGWLLRLRLVRRPHLTEAQAARDLLPPHVQIALWELDTWIATRTKLDQPGDEERVAVVLAWCEQLFRAGPAAITGCTLLRLTPGDGPAELLDLVPERLIDQLAALAAVAQDQLLPLLSSGPITLGLPLGRRPIAADADLLAGSTLLEIKCSKGSQRTSGTTFALGVDLIRQLLGYVLLAGGDHAPDRVGVYAARFGLLWTLPATDLIQACSGHHIELDRARSAFARLWRQTA